ncbi:MAG TPA: hypothetical protein VIK98_08385, partial [Limnochordales bacterium]
MRCLVLIGDRSPHPALAKRLPGFVFSQDLQPDDWTCVFRWGATHGRDDGLWVVNAREAILNASGPDGVAILRLNNLPAAPGVEPRWRVHVFDLRTLAVQQWSGRRLRHAISGGARLLARLRQLGRRACYALGLHFGAVDIGVTSAGQLAVVRVVPAPSLDARLARRWAHAMETYVAAVTDACATALGQSPGREVVLGADPEFILRSRISGRTVSASRFFSRFGTVGL